MSNETTIEEKLRVVAEFMGYTYSQGSRYGKIYEMDEGYSVLVAENNGKHMWEDAFSYHTDYNELNKVWCKFVSTGIMEDSRDKKHDEYIGTIGNLILYAPIIVAFDELYSAIVWLNLLNKTTHE